MSQDATFLFGLFVVAAFVISLFWIISVLREPAKGETEIISVDEAYGRGKSQAGTDGGSGMIDYPVTDAEIDAVCEIQEAKGGGNWWDRDGYQHQPAGQTLTHDDIYGAAGRGVDSEPSTDIEIVSITYHKGNGK